MSCSFHGHVLAMIRLVRIISETFLISVALAYHNLSRQVKTACLTRQPHP